MTIPNNEEMLNYFDVCFVWFIDHIIFITLALITIVIIVCIINWIVGGFTRTIQPHEYGPPDPPRKPKGKPKITPAPPAKRRNHDFI